MKIKLLFLFFIFFILLFTDTYSQMKNNVSKFENNSTKRTYSLFAGSQFYNLSGNTYWRNYIAPKVSFKITPKFNINTSFIFSNIYTSVNFDEINNNRVNSGLNPLFGNFNGRSFNEGNYFIVEGEYLFSDKLSLTGSGFIQIPVMKPDNKLMKNPLVHNNKDFHIGFNYKVTEAFQISADFGVTNKPSLIYSNPFNPLLLSNPSSFY